MQKTKVLITLILLAAIIAAVVSIFFQLRKPQDDRTPPMDQIIGEALAEEVAHALANTGQIVLVTLEKGQSPELDKCVDAFKHRIYKTPIKVANTDKISSEKAGKYGPGSGMSGKRFVRIMRKYPPTHLIVSFVGTPDGEDKELRDLGPPLPQFIAFSRAPDDIDELFQHKLLVAAIVPRFQFPAPGPEKPKTNREWFEKYYQVVRAGTDKTDR
jgi:hypothetical protein